MTIDRLTLRSLSRRGLTQIFLSEMMTFVSDSVGAELL